MTYTALETSSQSGRPVELYEFMNGTTAYRYTSADGDVSYGGNAFAAAQIARGAVEATSETARLALEITCARSLGVLALFATMPPEEVVAVTLRRLHAGDGEAITLWMGRVLNVSWNNASASIHCESVYTSLKRVGLRRLYQKGCTHPIYGPGCGLDRDDFKVVRTVATVTGTTITLSTLSGYADGYFAGGYLELEKSAGVFERRAIRSQTGAVVTIGFPLPGMSSSALVNLYPGCDHSLATCDGKFANRLNYGGQPYYPDKNPFNGVAIY